MKLATVRSHHLLLLPLLFFFFSVLGCREQECKRAAEMKCQAQWNASERERIDAGEAMGWSLNEKYPIEFRNRRDEFLEPCVAQAHYECVAGGTQ